MFPSGLKLSQMVLIGPKWIQIGSFCPKLYQIFQNSHIWSQKVQIVTIGPKWSQVVSNGPNDAKWSEMVSNGLKWFQMIKKNIKKVQHVSKWPQNGHYLSQMVSYGLKIFHRVENGPNEHICNSFVFVYEASFFSDNGIIKKNRNISTWYFKFYVSYLTVWQ